MMTGRAPDILKADELYLCLPEQSEGRWLEGLYCRDTRYLRRYRWHIEGAQCLRRVPVARQLDEYWCMLSPNRSQSVSLERRLQLNDNALQDRWHLRNWTADPVSVTLSLDVVPDMRDLFASLRDPDGNNSVEVCHEAGCWRATRIAADGLVHAIEIRAAGIDPTLTWVVTLAPGGSAEIAIGLQIAPDPRPEADVPALPSLPAWRAAFADIIARHPARRAVRQAVDDLHLLLLRTAEGPYPAAGAPIFVNLFGRDALITGMMLLPWQPSLLGTVLRFLAARQGCRHDPVREEEPGKILHEMRRGELSRTSMLPFACYYGSVDATPLFVVAAHAYAGHPDADATLVETLRLPVRLALTWLLEKLAAGDGLAHFEASGSGLTVQSWKDSADSMVHSDGRQARQPLSVAEVQGYAYDALRCGAVLLRGEDAAFADTLEASAVQLYDRFNTAFWLDDLGTYAMALEADGTPLRVVSSDPGHLLWSGIVPDERAQRLAERLLADDAWSGWGLRTLGARETAYNPISYHCGSVWPHDTALFALGLARYRLIPPMRQVAQALLDLAEACPGQRIPELIAGTARDASGVPVAYTHANAPQSWSAASVIAMADLLARHG